MSNPYSAPYGNQTPEFQGPAQRPAVLTWYRVYVVLMMLVYVLLAIGGSAFLFFKEELLEADPSLDETGIVIQAVAMIVISLPLICLFGAGLFVRPTKFTWIYGIVLIALGMTSVCCLPMTIPILIFWLREDSKRWFNA